MEDTKTQIESPKMKTIKSELKIILDKINSKLDPAE